MCLRGNFRVCKRECKRKCCSRRGFILKVRAGSVTRGGCSGLDAVRGRSELHVAALRGTGHRLALTAPYSRLLQRVCRPPDARHIEGPWSGTSSPGAATCCRPELAPRTPNGCRYCDRLLHFFLGLTGAAVLGAVNVRGSSSTGNVQQRRRSSDRDWGAAAAAAARSAAADTELRSGSSRGGAEVMPKLAGKTQRFKSRKGNICLLFTALSALFSPAS